MVRGFNQTFAAVRKIKPCLRNDLRQTRHKTSKIPTLRSTCGATLPAPDACDASYPGTNFPPKRASAQGAVVVALQRRQIRGARWSAAGPFGGMTGESRRGLKQIRISARDCHGNDISVQQWFATLAGTLPVRRTAEAAPLQSSLHTAMLQRKRSGGDRPSASRMTPDQHSLLGTLRGMGSDAGASLAEYQRLVTDVIGIARPCVSGSAC